MIKGANVGARVACVLVAACGFLFGCSSEPPSESATLGTSLEAVTGGGASLQLQELTNSCGANQAQQFFKVVNAGTTGVKVSDVKIKFWVDDTSVSSVVATLSAPGCVLNAGNPSCVHTVPTTKATITATKFSPACGPDATHQANWEITLSSTDTYLIPAGGSWSNIQTALRLANGANFSPGSSKWYSRCLSGSAYQSDNHFSLYYQNNLVFASDITAPDCRAPHGAQPLPRYQTPEMASAPLVGPVPQTQVLHLMVGLPLQHEQELANLVADVSNPSSPNYRHYIDADALAATYGPTSTDYQNVTSWAQSKGLSVDSS